MSSKKPTKSSNSAHFFWDKKASKHRSRFNLLLLEYGEYLLEDLSAFYFPIPTHDLSTAFEVKDSLKIQGRLKLCTRSLIFEPTESRYPIIKFPYKSIPNELEVFNLKHAELSALSVELSGFFTFLTNSCFEIKENNKIAPYKAVEYAASGGHRSVFALVHADITVFLVKVEQLRHIFNVSQRQGTGAANQLLRPFIETAQLWTLHFDTTHLVNFHEKLLFAQPVAAKKVKPLIVNPGSLMLTETRVYFQPAQLNNIGDSVLHFEVRNIARVFRRRYLLRQTGLEFILTDNTSHLFVLDTVSIRDITYSLLVNLRALSPQAHDSYSSGGNAGSAVGAKLKNNGTLAELCRRWQRRDLSNYEYLMALNSEGDRSLNDLTQYPVFPHVIADFKSKKLQLDNPATFRDLSKPIGALNPERLEYFKSRMQSMPPADPAFGIPPPFLYGTHYSTPGYVLHYLVRVAPEYMLCLQNGKFDAPDRMFHNMLGTWQSCLQNPTDLKELIPEFYTGSGEFLVNFDDLDLGHLHTGERLADVELPPWADSPRDFIRKMSKALECENVSDHLHEWIDLIFGYKQQGVAAVEADNLYYYLTYEGAVDLDAVTDSRERDALIMQIQEFGQTPKQLFTAPHPCRNLVPGASAAAGASGSGKGSPETAAEEAEERTSPVRTPPVTTLPSSTVAVDSNLTSSTAVSRAPSGRRTPSADSGHQHSPTPPSSAATVPINTAPTTSSTPNRSATTSRDISSAEAQATLEELLQTSEHAVLLLQEEKRRLRQSQQNVLQSGAGGSSKGAVGGRAAPIITGDDDEEDGVGIMHVDESFKLEVAQLLGSGSISNSGSNLGSRTGSGTNLSVPRVPSPPPAPLTASPTSTSRSGKSQGGAILTPVSTPTSAGLNHSASVTAGSTSSTTGSVSRERKPADSLLTSVYNWTFGTATSSAQRPASTAAAGVSGLKRADSGRVTPPPLPTIVSPTHRAGSSPVPTNDNRTSSMADSRANSSESTGNANTNTTAGAGAGAEKPSFYDPPANTEVAAFHRGNPKKIVMLGSEAFYWHSKPVTGVSVALFTDVTSGTGGSAGSGASRGAYVGNRSVNVRVGSAVTVEVTHMLVASVARDANLKVSRIEQGTEGQLLPGGGLQVDVQNTTVSPRRTTSVSGSSLSACILLSDKNHIIFSSWDNSIYGYSISHAHAMGKTYAHEDAVTCLSVDKRDKWLLSGSLDASVRLWTINSTSASAGAPVDNVINPRPVAEFFDHESPVHCVCIDEFATLAAAGADDGTVIVWDLRLNSACFTHVVSPAKRAVNCVKWLPASGNRYKGVGAFADEKLLCASDDGALICLDRTGKLYAATQLDTAAPNVSVVTAGFKTSAQDRPSTVSVRCLQCDGRIIYGGCSDGSMRCWVMSAGNIVEVYRHSNAHSSGVNSISLTVPDCTDAGDASTSNTAPGINAKPVHKNVLGAASKHSYGVEQYTAVLVSAGDDCSVKVWRVYFSGDY